MTQNKAVVAPGNVSSPTAGAKSILPADYPRLLHDIKSRIRTAQIKATFSANREMILMYWDIGRMIVARQQKEGWGSAVIPRLSRDIRNEMPEVKGFSERNIGYMIRFAGEYGEPLILQQPVAKLTGTTKGPQLAAQIGHPEILPQAVAKTEGILTILQQLVAELPWGQNIVLMEKVKDLPARLWYMQRILEHGWSRPVLHLMIESRAHERQGKAVTNFIQKLPPPQSDLAQQVLKDPYIFDFLTLQEPFHEREMEISLIRHLEKFLLELGQGFAFVGRQFHLDVGDDDFYVDLLFYHFRLRCFVVIDLKKGAFKPEYAGKMNFYCSVVDDRMRHATDNPTIGLILCQDRNKVVAEYALRGVRKPIGVSEYQLTRALPRKFKSVLPTIEEIEAELSEAPRGKPRGNLLRRSSIGYAEGRVFAEPCEAKNAIPPCGKKPQGFLAKKGE
ncbi:MAG: PDDEXK nuclease domain-containing protein [Kiritimatiellaeota bacterium]|nr:PDDEXK nuclease domain-containing protein [Kiritimatiellota bacterium]